MRRPKLIGCVGIAVAMLLSSCSSGTGKTTSSTTAESTAPPTTVAPATTTSTTTTTTTTLPPGLQPQVLTYGAADNEMWTQDASVTTTVRAEITDFEYQGMTDLEMDPDTEVTVALEGQQRMLFLGMRPEEYEAILDIQFDGGTVTAKSGPGTYSQDLTAQDLAADTFVVPPIVMTRAGDVATGTAGAPGAYRVDGGIRSILTNLGPVLSTQPVDEGDSWPITGTDSLLGHLTGQAHIADEVEVGDEYGFAINFEANADDLPAQATLEEMSEIEPYGSSSWATVVNTVGRDAVVSFDIIKMSINGSMTLLPGSGVPHDTDIRSHLVFTMTIEDPNGRMVVDYYIDNESAFELTEDEQANSFEAASVLDQYRADPFTEADSALNPLLAFPIDAPDDDVIDSVMATLMTTPESVASGWSAIGVLGDNDDDRVDVISLANDGPARGYPNLAGELVNYWTGEDGRKVSVDGKTAYRTTIDDREWLVWNSDTATFIIVGKRSRAQDVLSQIIDSQQPYLWQAGDCVTSDSIEDMPYAPFGVLGLTHCANEHGFEVIHSELLPDGPSEPYPDDLGDRLRQTCGAEFYQRFGVYPLEASFDMISYVPDPDEWQRGSRYFACVVYQEDGEGLVTTRGRFTKATSEDLVEIEPSTCLIGSTPVPCADPHSSEVLSVGTYEAADNAPAPDFEAVWDDLDGVCATALDAYGHTEGELDVDSGFLSDMPYGWENGVRSYYCIGYAVDGDGRETDITGSLRSAWKVAPEQTHA
jgi:hypothetical protein